MSDANLALNAVENLVAQTEAVVCRGESFTMKAFGVRKLQKALPHIAIIGSLLQVLDDNAEDDVGRIFALVTHGGDALLELLGLAIDKPVDWFDDADPFEVCGLALAVARVNIDFFVNAPGKLAPLKQQAAALMSRFNRSAG